MEEERKKHPPVPSNFVTLVQLQERWLEEQQRKQRVKGEEEERNRRVKEEEEVRKSEDQENQMREKETGKRSKTNTLYRRRPFFRENRRNQPEKSSVTIGMIDRKSEESQVGAIVVDDGERKIDDLNKKKKKKNKKKGKCKKKKGKPRAEEDLIVGTEQSLPEYEEAAEKIPVLLTERDGEKEGVTTEFKRNGKNFVVNDMVWEKKVPMAGSAEIGRKFENLSLSGGKGGNERYPRNMHGGQWKYNRGGSGSFNHGRLQKPRDSNLVWVKKGDTSDVSVARVWSSGGLAKAGEGQKKPVQMRPKESSWR